MLSSNLEKIGQKPVDLSLVVEIDHDIDEQERSWQQYQAFINGIRSTNFVYTYHYYSFHDACLVTFPNI